MTATCKPKYWPDGQAPRTIWARYRSPTLRLGLRAAAPPLPPDALHFMSVTSISSQNRAPYVEPTDRSRTVYRLQFYAHIWAYVAPDRHVRAAAGSGQGPRYPG